MSAQLPDELLLQIFSLLPPQPLALHGGYEKIYRNLALSSRRFYRLIRPFAWRSLTLYGIKTLRPQALQLCSRLIADPLLAQAVRSLTLISWDLGPDAIYLARAGQTLPDAYAVIAGQSRESSRQAVYAAVRALTRLEVLHIERCAFEAPFEETVLHHPTLRDLTLSGSSFHTHAFHQPTGGPGTTQLVRLSINGGSEDRSYLDVCVALAAGSTATLAHLELVKTLGSAGSLLLPDLCTLHYPALVSFTLSGLAPLDVEHVARLLSAHPRLESLTLLQDVAESQLAPPIRLTSYPWTLLPPSRPPHLTTFAGPAALVPVFVPGCPVTRVTVIERAGSVLLEDHAGGGTAVADALARSTAKVRTLELHAGRLEGPAMLRAASFLLPGVEELRIAYVPPGSTRFSKSKMLSTLAPSLQKFYSLRTLALRVSTDPTAPPSSGRDRESDLLGDLPAQYALMCSWSRACVSLSSVQLSELVRWVGPTRPLPPQTVLRRDGRPLERDWKPVFAEDTVTHLARLARGRGTGLIPPQPATRDWDGRLGRFMREEGCADEYREWEEWGEGE